MENKPVKRGRPRVKEYEKVCDDVRKDMLVSNKGQRYVSASPEFLRKFRFSRALRDLRKENPAVKISVLSGELKGFFINWKPS